MTFLEFFVGLGLVFWCVGVFYSPWSVTGKLLAFGLGLLVSSLNIYLSDHILISILTYELVLVGFYLLKGSIARNQLNLQIFLSVIIWLGALFLVGRFGTQAFQVLRSDHEGMALLAVVILASKAGFIVPFGWWENKISSDNTFVSGLGLCFVTSVVCSTIYNLLLNVSDSDMSLLGSLLLVSSCGFVGSSLVHSGVICVIDDWYRFNGAALLFIQVHMAQAELNTLFYMGFCLYLVTFLALLSNLEKISRNRLKSPQFLDFASPRVLSEFGTNAKNICNILFFWGLSVSGVFLFLCLYGEKFQVQSYAMVFFSSILPALFYIRVKAGRPFV